MSSGRPKPLLLVAGALAVLHRRRSIGRHEADCLLRRIGADGGKAAVGILLDHRHLLKSAAKVDELCSSVGGFLWLAGRTVCQALDWLADLAVQLLCRSGRRRRGLARVRTGGGAACEEQ